jgi:DNA-binding MarR family transcriptional regulator
MKKLRNFGFLLKDVSRRYGLRFEQRARAFSLTLPQCKALVRLEHHEGISQAKLAEATDVDPMTMVRIVDRMEADGLLERRADPSDRRARTLYLTPKAKPLLNKIWQLAEATRAEVFAGVSARDRDTFMAVLQRLHENVCAFDDGAAAAVAAARAAAPSRGTAKRARKTRTGK